jgi:hypothetical protein
LPGVPTGAGGHGSEQVRDLVAAGGICPACPGARRGRAEYQFALPESARPGGLNVPPGPEIVLLVCGEPSYPAESGNRPATKPVRVPVLGRDHHQACLAHAGALLTTVGGPRIKMALVS